MTEFLTSPTPTESFPKENFEVFTEMTPEEFKWIMLGYVDYKVVRVSPELIEKLRKYSTKSSKNRTREQFSVQLSDLKKKEVYKGLSNDEIRDLDSQKILWELQNGDISIDDMIVVRSTKKQNRIFGVAYVITINGKQKVRYYIRYSTLKEKTEKAQRVIDVMTERVNRILQK
jgi:hypothetical protein